MGRSETEWDDGLHFLPLLPRLKDLRIRNIPLRDVDFHIKVPNLVNLHLTGVHIRSAETFKYIALCPSLLHFTVSGATCSRIQIPDECFTSNLRELHVGKDTSTHFIALLLSVLRAPMLQALTVLMSSWVEGPSIPQFIVKFVSVPSFHTCVTNYQHFATVRIASESEDPSSRC